MTLYAPIAPDQYVTQLSEIDRQIVTLLAAGLTHKEVGAALGYAETTMKNRAHGIYNRIGLPNTPALVAWALLTEQINGNDVRELWTVRYPHLAEVK